MSLVDYIGKAKSVVDKFGIHVGDLIEIKTNSGSYIGRLLPRSHYEGADEFIVVKLTNGYNIGISVEKINSITLLESLENKKNEPPKTFQKKKDLPHVVLISTGGTISSKIDYSTGAVSPALTAEDLYLAVPELKEIVNIEVDVLFNELSENIYPEHWEKLAERIFHHIENGVDGIIVAHGTDTLGYTAAALSFALQNLPVPIVLVGSQRSSDRPSSDAFINLRSAAVVAGYANLAEVVVVMHSTTSDDIVGVFRGTKVRKMHTSARNAFVSINIPPLGFVKGMKYIENIAPIRTRNKNRKILLKNKFDKKVALVYSYPGLLSDIFTELINNRYSGILIAGTGLGHISNRLHKVLKSAIENDIVIAIASQCIFGRTNLNVYSTGVNLQKIGIIESQDMFPETAYVKLLWALSNYSKDKAISIFQENIVGEIIGRTYPETIFNR